MFSFLYNCVVAVAFLFYLPSFLYDLFTRNKYRKSFIYRLGIKIPAIERKTSDEKILWVHAVSLGETKSGSQLIQEIKKNHPQFRIVFSSGTETGHAEAKKLVGEENAFFLPLDFSWTIRKLVQKIHPNIVMLIETDFWYHQLFYAKELSSKILLVSGKISKRSTRFYSFFPKFTHNLFSLFDLLSVQNNAYKKRFQTIGVDPAKMFVTGNLKYDQDTPFLKEKELLVWKERMGIYEGDRVITIASTHASEEKWLLDALQKVWQKESNLKVLLAPRHPERFASVATLLKNENIPYATLSKIHLKTSTERVLLIDTMGFLPICYQLSELSIMGGSFLEKIGGHNILEPNFYHVPVFFGPHMATQVDLRKMVLQAKAGAQIPLEDLGERVGEFLADENLRASMGKAAESLVQSLKGRNQETYQAIRPFLA